MWSLHWKLQRGTKININGLSHMTKMVARPIYRMVKTFKNLLQNQKYDDLETWRGALGTQVLQIYRNNDPRLTLTFFRMVKFGLLCC